MELCVRTPPVTAKLESAMLPPTAPVNVTAPVPAFKVNASAPLRVVLKAMAPLLADVVIVALPMRLAGTGKVRVLAPVTVILFPIWMSPALVKMRFVSAVVPPIIPLKVTVPVPAAKVNT